MQKRELPRVCSWQVHRSFNGRGADFDLANGTAGAVYQIGSGNPDITGGTSAIESVGNGWYRCSINGLTLTAIRAVTIANNNGNLSYIWGASIRPVTAGDAYIKTNATAQTSAVLVPEGLTAGASIFGTDIITPRNAFALNLDGASWVVHGFTFWWRTTPHKRSFMLTAYSFRPTL
jgi:hypothetical protein